MNGECYFSEGLSPTLTTNKGEGSKVAIPVLTPERANKRQNGRRFKEDGEEAFTLTAQDRHGVAVCVEDFYQSRPVRTYDQEAPTLRSDRQGLKVAMDVSPVGIIDDQGRFEKKCTITDTVPTLRSETHGNLPKVLESIEVEPEVIGGIGEKNFGKQWRQGNRIYDGEKIATALEAHPVGNAGGNTNLYAVEIEPLEMSGHEVSESEDESHALNCSDQRKVFGAHQTRTMVGYNATLKRGGGYNADSHGPECERLQRSEREQPDDDRSNDVFAIDKGIRAEEREIANCITAREDRGLSKHNQEGTLICTKI